MTLKQAALVTGGAVRLGRHIAAHLAGSGWDIALHYHSSIEEAQKTRDEIRKLGSSCEIFSFDFLREKDYGALLEKVFEHFPRLNLLVNNASLYEPASLKETSMEMWETQFAVNLQAPFFLMQGFAQGLEKKKLLSSF